MADVYFQVFFCYDLTDDAIVEESGGRVEAKPTRHHGSIYGQSRSPGGGRALPPSKR
jgi:hypothetical protein